MTRRPLQLDLVIRTWGGRRKGTGRKPAPGRRPMPHRRRAPHNPRHPVHVTLRAAAGVASLRGAAVFAGLERAFAAASTNGFRLLQFSVQSNHLHLLVEADTPTRLTRGVQGLAVRTAKAINRVLSRHGRVWAERFHAHALRTPREVRHAFVYVLNNVRKHVPGVRGLDPRSSALFFDGWRTAVARLVGRSPVARPRTWLASVGWRRRGLIDVDEVPRNAFTLSGISPARSA
jgi:REP element-mobilizing transposase RayT